MKKSLLETVQWVLSSMDGDEVSNYNDTAESYQVALLAQQVYFDIVSELDLYEQNSLINLDSPASASTPIMLTVPTTVYRINSIRHNRMEDTDTYADWNELTYCDWETFINRQNQLREQTSDVGSMDLSLNGDTFEVMFRTDEDPKFYTVVGDYTLLVNSYNSDEDTYIAAADIMARGDIIPTFTLANSTTPTLNPQQWSYYLNRVKTRAFLEIKQQEHPEAVATARNHKIRTQKNRKITPGYSDYDKVKKYGKTT